MWNLNKNLKKKQTHLILVLERNLVITLANFFYIWGTQGSEKIKKLIGNLFVQRVMIRHLLFAENILG